MLSLINTKAASSKSERCEMSFKTDQVQWYNNGVWGELGYAVPNFGNDPTTTNGTIAYLVDVIGRNLSAIMQHQDASLRVPPSINTITRIHKLVLRARTILAGRDVEPHEFDMESQHVSPTPEDFVIYPVPFFKVRNRWMKEYANYVLTALSEAMQHTENRKTVEISQAFAGQIGKFYHRVYTNMAIELFGVERSVALAPGFVLTDEQLAAYEPSAFFTSTEMVDTVPRLDRVFTEDQLAPLAEGIPVTSLPQLQPWPTNLQALYQEIRGDDVNADDDAFVTDGNADELAGTGGETSGREQPIVPPAPAHNFGPRAFAHRRS